MAATGAKTDIGAAKGFGRKLKAIGKAKKTGVDLTYGPEQARMAADAERGQQGQANTLSGQVNTDLSLPNWLAPYRCARNPPI